MMGNRLAALVLRATVRWGLIFCVAAALPLAALAQVENAAPAPNAPVAAPTPAQALALGHALAQARCGRCHAVERKGASPLEKAPPLRQVAHHYPMESLAEALAEGIVTGHPDMPSDPMPPEDVDLLIGWLAHIAQKH